MPRRLGNNEELEDLEFGFIQENSYTLNSYERELVRIRSEKTSTREESIRNCQAFIDTYKQLQSFCISHGRGGKIHFNNMWKGDPRYTWALSELKFLKKYPDGVKLEHAVLEIYRILEKEGPQYKKTIYHLLDYRFQELVSPALNLMAKIRAIEVDEDYPKLFYLPNEYSRNLVIRIRGNNSCIEEV